MGLSNKAAEFRISCTGSHGFDPKLTKTGEDALFGHTRGVGWVALV